VLGSANDQTVEIRAAYSERGSMKNM